MSKTTFTYGVSDGYAGGSAPQHVSIYHDDIIDCETEDEAYDIVADIFQDDFLQKVSPSWNEEEVREMIRKIRAEKDV
jgi:hypothetical protein